MIVTTLNESERYYVLGENVKKALEWLKANDIRNMEDGRYALDGTMLSKSRVYLFWYSAILPVRSMTAGLRAIRNLLTFTMWLRARNTSAILPYPERESL